MKKLLKLFSFSLVLFALFSSFSSANNCIQRNIGDNSICVDINKSSNRYTLDSDINCRDDSCAVICDILLPDNTLTRVGTCNGTFQYRGNGSQKIKLYITINNAFATIETYYDFSDGSRGGNGGGSSSYSNNEVRLSTNKTNPSTSEYVRLTIDTDDDYVGKINFYKVQYRSSTNDSWSTISRTNSSYFSNYSDEWNQGYYRMKSSDYGTKTISNFVKFAKRGYYKIYAQDEDDNSTYIQFTVGNSSSSNNELSLTTNKRNPTTSEYIDLTIETDDDYVGEIELYAKYKSSSSDSWTSISNRSNYFSSYSSAWSNGYTNLSYSNHGSKTLSSIFKFAKRGYYRIYVKDENNNTSYVDFTVGNSSSSNNELNLSANKNNPTTSEYIDLTIETDDDYVGEIELYAKYKSSSSDSWTSISNRSNYFSNYSSAWSNGYTNLTYSNYGSKTLSSIFKFAKRGYYRIYVKDENGNTDYMDFNVGGSSSSNDDIEISANDNNPSTSKYIDLEIDTDDDYVGKVYLTAKYRSSTSSSWSTISNTSSTYFSNRSTAWSNGYVSLTSSSNGHKELNDAFKFAKNGYYRIYAEDENGNTDYIDFNVGGSSSSNDNIDLEANDTRPDAGEYIDLTVTTDRSYRGKINFSAKYRSSTSSSWANISRTSSTYFVSRSTTWNNGYINMTSSDYGEKAVENVFKFAKRGYYRIIVEDEDGNSTYLDFNVDNPNGSPLDGFTQKEFEMIERIYNVWPTLISKLRYEYPRLKNNSTWKTLSDDLYKDMGDVIDKKSNREFQDYDDFDTAFRYRFSYTQRFMD